MTNNLLGLTSEVWRISSSLAISFIATLVLGKYVIKLLHALQLGQKIYEYSPASHQAKQGTPGMGGVLIIVTVLLASILCCDLTNRYVWCLIFTLVSFGVVGFIDDYSTIKRKLHGTRGLSPKVKYLCQSLLAVVVVIFVSSMDVNSSRILVPFYRDMILNLGFLYLVLAYFMLVGTSNAVNLTDGLDGLAIVPIMLVATVFGVCAFVAHDAKLTGILAQFYIAGSLDIAIFCAALVGSGLGFLWFNAHPAKVFMGDVGSLSLGATLALIAMLVKQELLLLIIGGVFVVETLSVILQVGSMKLRQKRIFKMAPIHHHFELLGLPETVVVLRFWIVSILLAVIGLISLFI